jgi:hypothetical protein
MKQNGRMGLIDRIFKNSPAGKEEKKEKVGPATQSSTQFYEDDPDSDDAQGGGRNAPRRELVQVILRDTMRKHGIPSDWIESRVLSAVTRTGRRGLHVNFVVKQAHERLLPYVFPFQDSFEKELARFEPRCRDWLLSLGWEFTGVKAADMPDPKSWDPGRARPSGPLEAAQAQRSAPTAEQAAPDESIESDLQALFAIRDAAMADTNQKPQRDPARPDFEDTHPGQT